MAEEGMGKLRAKLLEVLRECGPMTDQEMQETLIMDGSTQRPRRVELERAGLIVQAGFGKTKAGRQARRWRVKD